LEENFDFYAMKFLINGYFGFGNAGDEAVLAAMLADLQKARPDATFCATSGDVADTKAKFGIDAVGRQAPKELMSAIQNCDVFLSGGGSLVQDVTSLRNVVYYTTLLRLAKLSGKPTMVYAQGVGPLQKPLSQKLARAAFQSAKIITVRDEESAVLLRKIGVSKSVEITADPVWGLEPRNEIKPEAKKWLVALRNWPNQDEQAIERLVGAIRNAANNKGARLQFLPMQPGPDNEILKGLAQTDEILDTTGKHPSEILSIAKSCELMLAMRLHALIFAAAGGVPVVAFDYDPKVSAVAKLLRAPLVASPSAQDLNGLEAKIEAASAPPLTLRQELKDKAMRTAQLAASLK
jgi:polysaccharide pyruvyl transferase CsaB